MAKEVTDKAVKLTSHTITTTIGGIALLKEVLPAPGWYGETKGNLDVKAYEVTEILSDVDITEEADVTKTHTFVVNESQRDAVKTCLRFFRGKAALKLTKHVMSLYSAFGVIEA